MKQGRADKSGRASGKVEPRPHGINPAGPAQLGLAVQFHKEPVENGPGYKGASPRPAAAGPGGGRTIHRSGSQGRH